MKKVVLALVWVTSLSWGGTGDANAQPRAAFAKREFDFGRVVRGTVVEHGFVLKNHGTATLRLGNVRMDGAITVTSMPARVEPGAEASIRVRVDTATLRGPFEGLILVSFRDASAADDVELTVTGAVVAAIEASPPAFFVSVERGHTEEQSIEIRNHEAEPLEIQGVDFPSGRGTVKLEPIVEGRRFRLTLTARGDGPAGKKTEVIRLTTSSPSTPVLLIPANNYVRERVYTFPDAVDLGAMPIAAIKRDPAVVTRMAQTLMVYRKGTQGFEARATTDLPMLRIAPARGPEGDRWQFTITLNQALVSAGPIEGFIFIETNDPEFPRLTVPVSGQVFEFQPPDPEPR